MKLLTTSLGILLCYSTLSWGEDKPSASDNSAPAAGTIYKYTDKQGQTIYSDKPPSSRVKTTIIPPSKTPANVWESNKNKPATTTSATSATNSTDEPQAAATPDAQLVAQQKLHKAEAALRDARVLKAGDYFRNKNGGLRYNADYLKRVSDAEKERDDALKAFQDTPKTAPAAKTDEAR